MNQDLTVLLLTYNERANIQRTLSHLARFERVVVLDSGSTDGTQENVRSFSNTTLVVRPFDNHTAQWNYGLTQCGITTTWVLSLDADYQLNDALVSEILDKTKSGGSHAGYELSFAYAVEGQPIRSGIYPPVIALFRREAGVYVHDGHTQRLKVEGSTGYLAHKALHDDRKPFERWIQSQAVYAKLEADFLLHQKSSKKVDVLRLRFPFTPLLVFLYCVVIRGGWRDGAPGWMYAWQRLIAEVFLQYYLLLIRIRK